jgi:hypothetical protein
VEIETKEQEQGVVQELAQLRAESERLASSAKAGRVAQLQLSLFQNKYQELETKLSRLQQNLPIALRDTGSTVDDVPILARNVSQSLKNTILESMARAGGLMVSVRPIGPEAERTARSFRAGHQLWAHPLFSPNSLDLVITDAPLVGDGTPIGEVENMLAPAYTSNEFNLALVYVIAGGQTPQTIDEGIPARFEHYGMGAERFSVSFPPSAG